jgi:hypothetical protein
MTMPPGLIRKPSARRCRSFAGGGAAHHAVQQRGEDDALQPSHDEHVGRRDDALVAAVVDVVADVPVHPEDGHLERDPSDDDGRDVAPGHAGDALFVSDESVDELLHGSRLLTGWSVELNQVQQLNGIPSHASGRARRPAWVAARGGGRSRAEAASEPRGRGG